jgi:hypothetical protein
MEFTVTIKTPARCKPQNRPDDVNERAAIQAVLLTIVSKISNSNSYEGKVTGHRGASAEFSYQVGETENV